MVPGIGGKHVVGGGEAGGIVERQAQAVTDALERGIVVGAQDALGLGQGGGRPACPGEGAAGFFVIFHLDGVQPRADGVDGPVGRYALVAPFVQNLGVVQPGAHAVVGGEGEGVGTFLEVKGARPAHAKVVVEIVIAWYGAAGAPIVVERPVLAAAQAGAAVEECVGKILGHEGAGGNGRIALRVHPGGKGEILTAQIQGAGIGDSDVIAAVKAGGAADHARLARGRAAIAAARAVIAEAGIVLKAGRAAALVEGHVEDGAAVERGNLLAGEGARIEGHLVHQPVKGFAGAAQVQTVAPAHLAGNCQAADLDAVAVQAHDAAIVSAGHELPLAGGQGIVHAHVAQAAADLHVEVQLPRPARRRAIVAQHSFFAVEGDEAHDPAGQRVGIDPRGDGEHLRVVGVGVLHGDQVIHAVEVQGVAVVPRLPGGGTLARSAVTRAVARRFRVGAIFEGRGARGLVEVQQHVGVVRRFAPIGDERVGLLGESVSAGGRRADVHLTGEGDGLLRVEDKGLG